MTTMHDIDSPPSHDDNVKATDPADLNQRLLDTLNRLFPADVLALTRMVEADAPPVRDLSGNSIAIRHLRKDICIVAGSDLNVLIQGETGVGKTLVARLIHDLSERRDEPFITLDCITLGCTPAEQEGDRDACANDTIAYALDRAGKGTLFLENPAELPPAIQTALVQALKCREQSEATSPDTPSASPRLIAATQCSLDAAVEDGRFRADLLHRLNAFPITVPPLRERGRDIIVLAAVFLNGLANRLQVRSLRLTPECHAVLLTHSWPGNVRELEHQITRAALRARADADPLARVIMIKPAHIDLPLDTTEAGSLLSPHWQAPPGGLREALDDFQRDVIGQTLMQANNNWAQAARTLKLDRGNLFRLAKRLGLQKKKA